MKQTSNTMSDKELEEFFNSLTPNKINAILKDTIDFYGMKF